MGLAIPRCATAAGERLAGAQNHTRQSHGVCVPVVVGLNCS